MSNGGYKGATPPRETSPEHYPGVWVLPEQYQAQADGNWPFQETDCAPKSLRFNASDSAYLSRVPLASGNRRAWTISTWLKRGNLGIGNDSYIFATSGTPEHTGAFFTSTDKLEFRGYNNAFTWRLTTTQVFRDPSAWYHLVFNYDSTNSVDADKLKLYVNGVRVETFDNYQAPSDNYETAWNHNSNQIIGAFATLQYNLDAELADFYSLDGQVLSPDAFTFIDGQGILQPKRFTGDFSSGPGWIGALSGTQFNSTYSLAKAFDGLSNTYSAPASSGTNVFAPVPAITGITKVKLRVYRDASTSTDVTLNGTVITSSFTNGQYTDAEFSVNNLTELKWTTASNNQWFGVSQIFVERNGVYELLRTPSVGLNSFHLDFSDSSLNAALGKDSSGLMNDWTPNNLAVSNNWPSYVYAGGATYSATETGKNFYTGSGNDLFDGTTNNYVGGENVIGGTLYFRPQTAITGVTSIELYGAYNGETRVNGSLVTVSPSWSSSDQYVSVQSPPSTITEISVKGDVGSSAAARLKAIKVNGSMLVDSGPSGADCSVDSPVNGNEASTGAGGERRGNYCCFNPLKKSTGATLSNGNLDVVISGTGGTQQTFANFGMSSGKWFWEVTAVSGNARFVGIAKDTVGLNKAPGETADTYAFGRYNAGAGLKWNNNSSTSYGTHPSIGDVVGVAFDADNGTLTFYLNGVSQGTAFTGISGTYFPVVGIDNTGHTLNAGQRPFHTAAPAGFSPLSTSFLPEPTIADGSKHFIAKLYGGNGSTQTISGVGFESDLVWVKSRSTAVDHILFDSVRGFGANKELTPNDIYAEGATGSGQPNTDVWGYVESVTSDGFVVNKGSNANGSVANTSGSNYVAWLWSAGDATTTVAAGGLNSSAYDQSQTWSSSLTSSNGFWSGQPATNAFDGDPGNNVTGTNNGGTLTFSPSNYTIPANSTIEIRCSGQSGSGYTVVVNGVSNDIGSGTTDAAKFHTVNYDGGTSLSVTVTSKSNYSGDLRGIRVNGKLLVDSGVSVTNVPSIPTTLRANPLAGMSIVKWNGTGSAESLAHGLNTKPEFIFTHSSNSGQWLVYHSSYGATKYTYFNNVHESRTYSHFWNDTEPTSTVFSIGNDADVSNSSASHVAFCFAPVEGYSKMGEYFSNGTNNFIFTGFRPALIICKRDHNTGDIDYEGWVIFDSKRGAFNLISESLYSNETHAEGKRGNGSNAGSTFGVDFLSNGFCFKDPSTEYNRADGGKYFYYAVAEHPSKISRAR